MLLTKSTTTTSNFSNCLWDAEFSQNYQNLNMCLIFSLILCFFSFFGVYFSIWCTKIVHSTLQKLFDCMVNVMKLFCMLFSRSMNMHTWMQLQARFVCMVKLLLYISFTLVRFMTCEIWIGAYDLIMIQLHFSVHLIIRVFVMVMTLHIQHSWSIKIENSVYQRSRNVITFQQNH